MKKVLAFIAAAGTAFASFAALANSTMDVLLGGAELEIASSEGSYTVQFSDDGTYTTSLGYGGTWSLDGDELCFERDSGESGCSDLPEGMDVGDSWDGDVAGTSVTFTIV
ncbi:MAG: hypothetical protein AAFR11_08875 [Pseudomonadota bacterium]